jgi:hypothetical protein
MKKLKVVFIVVLVFLLFVPMAFARGQAAAREREPAPQPPAPHIPAEIPRIDPSEPIRGSPATVLPNDVQNRVNDEGLVNVVPVRDGTVDVVGWVNPDNQNQGIGYRVRIDTGDGYTDSYGHLTPDSAPPVGTTVVAGETIIGTMGNPSNGVTTGPHVHVERRETSSGATVDPGIESPFLGPSDITSGYQVVDEGLRGGSAHSGVDHIPDWW